MCAPSIAGLNNEHHKSLNISPAEDFNKVENQYLDVLVQTQLM